MDGFQPKAVSWDLLKDLFCTLMMCVECVLLRAEQHWKSFQRKGRAVQLNFEFVHCVG